MKKIVIKILQIKFNRNFIIFFITIILFIYCLIKFNDLNSNYEVDNRIEIIFFDKQIDFENIDFTIFHKELFDTNKSRWESKNEIDVLKINATIENNSDSITKFTIRTDKSLILRDKEEYKVTITDRFFDDYKFFTFEIPKGKNEFGAFFDGVIFNNTNQEVRNSFWFDIDLYKKKYPKTSLTIEGLANYDNLKCYPTNAIISKYNSIYINFPESFNVDETIFGQGFRISGENSIKKYSNQTKSFLLTTLIGILISTIIQMLIKKPLTT